jgi:hypothetical protein
LKNPSLGDQFVVISGERPVAAECGSQAAYATSHHLRLSEHFDKVAEI